MEGSVIAGGVCQEGGGDNDRGSDGGRSCCGVGVMRESL